MYDFFRGRVAQLDASGSCSFEVAGIGYHLRISEHTRARLPLDGSETLVYARLLVREDDLALFGFADPAERSAFDLLTGVQGVGPLVALAILSTFTVAELRRVLLAGNAQALRQVRGVGPKVANRLALELADKVDRIPAPREDLPAEEIGNTAASHAQAYDEARQALVSLGFGNRDAVDALEQVAEPGHNAEELLRLALVLLR